MLTKQLSKRKKLSRWSGWFFFWNSIVILVIGISYLSMMPSYSDFPLLDFFGRFLGISFVIFAFIGQSALFVFIGGGIVYLLIQCVPKRWFVMLVSIVLASLSVLVLVIDAILYHLYHFHLKNLVWNILFSEVFNEIISLSLLEWLILIWVIIVIICLECLIAYWVWRHQQSTVPKRYGRLISLAFSLSLLLSYGLYFVANYITSHPKVAFLQEQVDEHLIEKEAKVVPYYMTILKVFIPESWDEINNDLFVQDGMKDQPLQYPQAPINAKAPKLPYNIVMIVIDSWRYDMMNARITPNIAAFSEESINFIDHYSGGNATQPGIFSLFYSLPSTYWSAMLSQQRGPVFIQQLLKEHYQMEIFASAALTFPVFDRTVFRDVPNLLTNTPGNSSQERDANITKAFNAFVNHRQTKQPFFGFLFYDAVHGYCEMGDTYPKPFQQAVADCDRLTLTNTSDPLPYINRYKNAVLYDDRLVGEVLQNLKHYNLLKNTIVIITADHGEEFNDEHLDYWGHSSAFDPYQLRTPLIVHWPNRKADTIYSQTSHYDIVPTLMTGALGVASPMRDYSIGHSLFSDTIPHYLIIGSYVNYAILQPNQTTIIYPGGNYDITYSDGYSKPKARLNPILMRQVYKELNDYYQ